MGKTFHTVEPTASGVPATWFDCLSPRSPREAHNPALAGSPSQKRCPAVGFIERATTRTLLVSWSDAQLGCIAEQVWTLSRARHDDRCAFSGEPIRRGQAVYRPRKTAPLAINAQAVIAAHHAVTMPIGACIGLQRA
ncbi:DUF3331 domain-containing protein [Caballeronia sp. ATUFL_M1_KS5A]|uniref:DUF3331 domain-containing protein n=1 Tax=Caballeronia sp. ATUFL_M1_KS5A TaxID=2921778 RepID=UPI0032EEA435